MRVDLEGDEAVITAIGLELLRIKTALTMRLGSAVVTRAGQIVFPARDIPAVSDLLPDQDGNQEVCGLKQRFREHGRARQLALDLLAANDASSVPAQWLERLDPPQAVAVAAMTVPGLMGFCLFDEQGSGKTVMTLAAFDILRQRGEIDAMVVACPKSMLGEWPVDAKRFIDANLNVVIADGSHARRFDQACGEFDVLVSTYEGLKHLRIPLKARIEQRRLLFVADESFNVKNDETARASYAQDIRKLCSRCFVLCGTPAPNAPIDVVNQFSLADNGFAFAGFRSTNDSEIDAGHIAAIAQSRGAYVRRLKADVIGDIPLKNFILVPCCMQGRQAYLYEEARRSLELELRSMDNFTFRRSLAGYQAKRAALLQICAVPSSIDPGYHESPAKYVPLDEYMLPIIGQGKKVIVWSSFTRSLDELCLRYTRFNPLRIDGGVSAAARSECVRQFQDHDSGRDLIIANPAAAGAGLNFQSAHNSYYLSFPGQAVHYLQSLDRTHRRGQIAPEVNYYFFFCENTIEQNEIRRLRAKELRQHSLFDDNIPWPTSLDEALAELTESYS